jgi:hypothetical protein
VDDEVVGCIIDASIADAALSHCFFASTIPFSSIPRKTTNNVDGHFFVMLLSQLPIRPKSL